MNYVIGVDVGPYSGGIKWEQVATAGAAYSFAKATEGLTVVNSLYESQRDGAKAAGLLTGAYHFFRTTSDPVAQARRFVELAGDVDLPLAIDIEDQRVSDPLGGLAPSDFCQNVHDCLAEVASLTGKKPIAYVEPSTWARLPQGPAAICASLADLWVATYGAAPRIPHGWTDWAFWQYTGNSAFPGIGPATDINRWNGTLDELKAYAGLGGTSPDAARILRIARGVDAGEEGLPDEPPPEAA